MALQLILGSSGQGKSTYLMDEIIRESMEHPTRQYYVLVPEQFSLEMQRQMVARHPRHGFSNIDVLSMHRLAYRVFDECNYTPKEILEDIGVSMILKKILLDHQEEILYFKRSMRQPGFLDELKSMLFEFMNYGIAAGDVEGICDALGGHPGLQEKCKELSKIYGWFTRTIEEHYMVTGQILDVLKEMVPQSAMLQEGYFYLDGYTGFTPIQLNFLRELLPRAQKVTITVTIPYLPGGGKKLAQEELFSFSEKTIHSLWAICRDSHTEVLEAVILQGQSALRYGKAEDLAHLEGNLFRQKAKIYKEKPEHIHSILCQSSEAEVEYVLHKIEELVRSRGYRYRDFAILMGNETDYPSIFQRKSQILGIPVFVDTSQKMFYHSGVETIRALFHMILMDYSYESVFRYLKAGMSNLSMEEIDQLENYVILAGIRGLSMWRKPFTRRLSSLTEEGIALIEGCREQLMKETLDFALAMKEKGQTVREKMTLLYQMLRDLRMPEKLMERGQVSEDKGDYVHAGGYRSFFPVFLTLMDKIVNVFGEEVFSLRDLSELVDAGLESLTLTTPPLSMDQVILGDLKRTRLPDIKVLFFVGMNDGDMPPVPSEQGILCDEEKRILREQGITLSLNLTERVLEDEYYMYLAFCKPQEELYLTYGQSGADGSARQPSSFFKTLGHLYPELKSRSYPEEERRFYFNEADSREFLIRQLRNWHEGREVEDDPRAFYALLAYWQQEAAQELQDFYTQMEKGPSWIPLSEEVTERLYGKELTGSVTRLETFASCPYRFFCNYGLQLLERKEYKIEPVDLGNLFHKALEYYSKELKETGYHWNSIPEADRDALIDRSVEVILDENMRDLMGSSHRNAYKKNMVKRVLQRTVEVLQYHLRNSSFEPDAFEKRFGTFDRLDAMSMPLSQGHQLNFNGVIDRVDICEEDGKLYVKIIDYKSGNTSFDFNKLYYGLQLQLVAYLNAALEMYQKEKGKAVEPAGLFYYHIQDPIQDAAKAADGKEYREFRMDGYANSDPKILDLLEHVDGDKTSFTAQMKKDGSPYANAAVMSSEDFHRVGDYVKESMRKIGERIYQGELAASPSLLSGQSACTYCPYVEVCGFETGRVGHTYQQLASHKRDDILEMIREEMD